MYKKAAAGELHRNYVSVDKIDKHIKAFKNAGGKELMGEMQVPKMGWSFTRGERHRALGGDDTAALIGPHRSAR